ncbi:hypothetical protein LC065_20075 (plasmid) [Halobacillus litoralis]|uniref:hypothetical protein n=1 Tax=Halobacillus litoralis TaxID=45668 RepID=UPI001CFE8A0E|nr:hypothetical protein [Halobacillus litoralis]WLR49606.1 hypothetical protein LC065_20075 [Halobacillus litoralis]
MASNELIQFRVGKNNKLVYDLVNKLKTSGGNQRGYISDQLRQRLTVYEVLAEMMGEDDPHKLLAKVSSAIMNSHTQSSSHVDQIIDSENEIEEPEDDVQDDLASFVNGNNL